MNEKCFGTVGWAAGLIRRVKRAN